MMVIFYFTIVVMFSILLHQFTFNVRKILDLTEMVNKPYEKVSIELDKDYNLEEIKDALKEEGETEINIVITENNKILKFKLEKTRKFDLTLFNYIKNKQYVKKISF